MATIVTDPVSRVRHIMDCAVSNAVAPLVENTLAIDAILNFFEDDESRKQYLAELTFMSLKQLMSLETARKYAGNVTFAQWHEKMELCRNRVQNGSIPTLRFDETVEPYWNLSCLTGVFVAEEYRYGDVHIRENDVVIDAGAFVGDTMAYALMLGAREVHCFEPEPKNRHLLLQNIESLGCGSRVRVVPKGLAQSDGTASFSYQDAASRVAEQGELQIELTSLDAYCQAHQVTPTLIKMDIEGSETQALWGSQNILRTIKPQLCISLYHSLQDMWVIPAIIKEIQPDYRFWGKSNSPYGEFVLYASV